MSRKPENLGIRLANCQNLFGKIDFLFSNIWKNRFSDPEKPEKSISVLYIFGKIDFHYPGYRLHTLVLPSVKL